MRLLVTAGVGVEKLTEISRQRKENINQSGTGMGTSDPGRPTYSFITQGNNWIDECRPPSRQVASQQG
jgi:hypothetical protein